jgi:hypothetical protein
MEDKFSIRTFKCQSHGLMLFVLSVAIDNLPFTEAGITLRTWSNSEKEKKVDINY